MLFNFFKKKEPAKAEPPQESQMSATEVRALINHIAANAEQHREICKNNFNLELNYGPETIPVLDAMIQKGWPKEPPANLELVVLTFGSYLGETIRRTHGGTWAFTQELGLYLDVGDLDIKIFPFAKVKKRFLNGEEDSLSYYYAFIRSQVEQTRRPA